MKNVILLTIDAARKDVFGCYGSQQKLTPFIDSLASESIIFSKAQSTGPYTQASFPGLLTSSYFLDFGPCRGLTKDRTLISEPLQRAGIVTAALHSNPYLCGFLGWNRGWDYFYDSMDDQVDTMVPFIKGSIINEKAHDWLSKHVNKSPYQPFFLWLHYMDAHEPYIPDKKFIDFVDPSMSISKEEMYALFKDTLLKRDVSDSDKVNLLKKLYCSRVREVDTDVQTLFGSLKNLGILENTTTIIISDHGDEFGEHGGLSHDDKMYSELIDVPLIIHGAGETGINNALVSTINVAPTIVGLFGLKPVPEFQGHPLLPSTQHPAEGVFGEGINQHTKKGGDFEQDIYYYREKDVKIIYRAANQYWELYDLSNDPREENNIIKSYAASEQMKAKLMPMVRRWLSKS